MYVYADHASTSFPTLFPTDCTESWANPGNGHALGVRARRALDRALEDIRACLSAPPPPTSDIAPISQIVVTANGTEGNNLVLQGYPWDYIITAHTEHTAVYFTAQFLATRRGTPVFFVPVDATGQVNPKDIEEIVRARCPDQVGLVSLMYVNNEVGSVHDLPAIATMLRANNWAATQPGGRVWFHTDAVQAPGIFAHLCSLTRAWKGRL